MVRVVVRFSPEVAARVAETRAGTPGRRPSASRTGRSCWNASLSGLREVRIWILGWGADAEVLEPAELRESIGAELTLGCREIPGADRRLRLPMCAKSWCD